MAEWVAGKGTTALGTIGTVLGGIAVANNGLGGILGNNYAGNCSENMAVNRYELNQVRESIALQSENSELRGELKMNEKVLDLYRYVDGELKEIRAAQNVKWTEQAVVNANVNAGLVALKGQADESAAILAQITGVAVRRSSICDIGCCNSGCGNNI